MSRYPQLYPRGPSVTRGWLNSVAALAVTLSAGFVQAHDFSITDVLVIFKTDGTYQIDLTVDADSLALGITANIDPAIIVDEFRKLSAEDFAAASDLARQVVAKRVRVRFDGVEHDPLITFPEYATPLADEAPVPTVLGTTARMAGRIPFGAKEFTFWASRAFNAVHITLLEQAGGNVMRHILPTGEECPAFTFGDPPRAAGRARIAFKYLVLGFEHILPKGLDHILFVVGLFLLSARIRPLLWQITAFTVAHSVTLALSILGIVSLPSKLVESLIALSIAYVAVENMLTSDLKPWRPVVVFLFGLLHGMGFAGVLQELGLPPGETATALITFNVGVELGQISVVLLLLVTVGWFRKKVWYRRAIVLPMSALIGLMGLYWAVERAL